MSSLKAIAMETNLAEATVSRILRNRDQCSPETRERVLAAAQRLRYRPNLLVRGMQTGRTQTVGVMLPVGHEFFGRLFEGVHDALIRHDQVPILLWCHDQLTPPSQQRDIPRETTQIYRLIDRRVDGVILRPVDDAVSDDYLRELWERQIPVIAVDRELEHTQADFVGIDDEAVGRKVAEMLLSLGHRRLGHITGPTSVTSFRRRMRGFVSTIQAAGASCVTVEDASEANRIWGHVFTQPNRPTAIFTGNDDIAMAVFVDAMQRGISVPQQLSIVGCGNLRSGAQSYPGLTSVDQHPREIGKAAVELLRSRLEGEHASGRSRRLVPFDLVIRGSTRSPSSV